MGERFRKIDKAVDRAGYWGNFMALIGGTAFFGVIANFIQDVGWALAFFIGLSGAIGLVLALSVGLFAWTGFRRFATRNEKVAPESEGEAIESLSERLSRLESGPDTDDIDYEAVLRGLSEQIKILDKSVKAIYADRKDWNDIIEDRFSAVHKVLENTGERLESGAIKTAEAKSAADRAQAFADVAKENSEELKDQVSQLNAQLEEISNWTRKQFLIVQVLAEITKLDAKIEPISDDLSTPTDAPAIEVDWEKWGQEFESWKRNVWLFASTANLALDYDVEETIKQIDSDNYHPNKWDIDFSRFPDDLTVHEYKTFRLLKQNYEMHGLNAARRIRLRTHNQ